MSSGQPTFTLDRPEQIEALAHPTRQDIVDRLVTAGPLAVAELARLVGRRPDALYYHLRILKRVGLIHRTGDGGGARYDVPGRPLRMRYAGGDERLTEAVSRAVGTMLRSARGDFDAAVRGGMGPTHGEERTVRASRLSAWLAPEEVREMNRRIEEILALFRTRMAEPPAEATLVELVVLTAPLPDPDEESPAP